MIVPAHPKEDVNASRTDKEKKVMKEEKNRNSQRPWLNQTELTCHWPI